MDAMDTVILIIDEICDEGYVLLVFLVFELFFTMPSLVIMSGEVWIVNVGDYVCLISNRDFFYEIFYNYSSPPSYYD